MGDAVRVRRSNPRVRDALRLTFPDYRGRKVSVAVWDRPISLDLHWSGGTRDKVMLLSDRGVGRLVVDAAPWAMAAGSDRFDPADFKDSTVLVVRSWFCGTDAGVTFYVKPGPMPALLMDGV